MEVTVRPLRNLQDYRACEALQRVTWGRDFQEVVPAAILKISQKVGGVAAGAFTPDGTMAGFVFGITGLKDGKPCHWSHMLAVEPAFRDQGIGQRLKQHQRQELLDNGVRVMFWTYDPLVARNAHMNLCRLGVDVTEYVPEMYGADDENSLDQIIGTDRFIVRWDLQSPAQGRSGEPEDAPLVNGVIDADGTLAPCDGDFTASSSVRIGIPQDIHALKTAAPVRAVQWRANTRRAFLHYFDAGYDIIGFSTNTNEKAGYYQLVRPRSAV